MSEPTPCPECFRKRYRIVRNYFNPNRRPRTIKRGLTLTEAQAHCRNPKTSHKTGPSSGWWFDGYSEE
jgi:hypothetical protein